jgi:hypothetical protein
MVSTSGAQLLPHEAIAQLSQHLLPHTTIVTPNIPEATLLLTQNGHQVGEIQSVSDVEAMGRKIQQLGPKWVLVKGGHMPFRKDLTVAKTDEEREIVVDVLVGPEGRILRVQSPYQKSTSTHGTGCSLACKYLHLNNSPKSYIGASYLQFHSRNCSSYLSRRRHAHRRPRRLSIHRSRHQDSAPARQRKRTARSFPLDIYSSFLSVSNPAQQRFLLS